MPKEVGHDGEGGGGTETGGSPVRVDGLETVCRRLLLDHNGSDTMERKQCHSLLDWLILRCNHQWQFMNLAGTPVTRAVLVEEVLEIMNAVKDNVTDADIVEELEKKGIVCDCHMNFVRDIHACALDVRDDDQCNMEELQRKLFPDVEIGNDDNGMDCDVLGGTATDDDHRSVDESRSAALQQSDEAPIDGHSKSKCAKSTEDSLLSSIMANVRVATGWLGITHSRTSTQRQEESINVQGGARQVRQTNSRIDNSEDRLCLLYALDCLLGNSPLGQAVYSSIMYYIPLISKTRDLSVNDVNSVLNGYGLSLIRASGVIQQSAYRILNSPVKLVVNVKLINKDNKSMSHFVGWDGSRSTVYDRPMNAKVQSKDRESKEASKRVFSELFSEMHSWQITHVYQLVELSHGDGSTALSKKITEKIPARRRRSKSKQGNRKDIEGDIKTPTKKTHSQNQNIVS